MSEWGWFLLRQLLILLRGLILGAVLARLLIWVIT